MKRIKSLYIFVIIFIIGFGAFLYHKYKWMTYASKEEGFRVKYPNSWMHNRSIDENGVISETWFVDGSGPLGGAGKSREGDDGVTLYIYQDPENQIFSDESRGPFKHDGKFYYFRGSDSKTVKAIISSFGFLN